MVGYTEAGAALVLSALLVLYVGRLRARNAFQKRALLLSTVLLVGAITSNLLIAVILPSANPDDVVVATKRTQALFDHWFALTVGAFVVATAERGVDSWRDLRRYLARWPPTFFPFYVGIVVAGMVGVLVTPADPVITGNTFTFAFPTWFMALLFAVTASFLFYVPYKLVGYLRRVGTNRRVVWETGGMIAGLVGYTVSELAFEVMLPGLGQDLRGLGFLLETALLAMVAYSVRERDFLELLIDAKPEANLRTERTYDLARGYGYLVFEATPRQSFAIFQDMVTHGVQGLCVTRMAPDRVSHAIGLEKTPILWLSRTADDRNCIRPRPLEYLMAAMEHFFDTTQNSVVLLDGAEYLITHNDFPTVLTFFQDIVEHVAVNNAVLLVPVNPKVFDEREMALLTRDLKVIVPEGGTPDLTGTRPASAAMVGSGRS